MPLVALVTGQTKGGPKTMRFKFNQSQLQFQDNIELDGLASEIDFRNEMKPKSKQAVKLVNLKC